MMTEQLQIRSKIYIYTVVMSELVFMLQKLV
jgi:predicted nucleic-acid-binding protein